MNFSDGLFVQLDIENICSLNSDGLFTFQIFRQTALAQNTAWAFMTTTDHAVITGMRMLADIIQRTHFIRQCPSLRFG